MTKRTPPFGLSDGSGCFLTFEVISEGVYVSINDHVEHKLMGCGMTLAQATKLEKWLNRLVERPAWMDAEYGPRMDFPK